MGEYVHSFPKIKNYNTAVLTVSKNITCIVQILAYAQH